MHQDTIGKPKMIRVVLQVTTFVAAALLFFALAVFLVTQQSRSQQENSKVSSDAPPLRGTEVQPTVEDSATAGEKKSASSQTDAPDLKSSIFDYVVIDQDLTVTLLEFARHYKLRIEIDREVRGRLRDRLPPSTGEEFLDRLAEQNQFDWFFDGEVLRITPLRQTTSRIIDAQDVDIKKLKATLKSLGISDRRHPLRIDESTGLLKLSGPPSFIAAVESTIAAIKKINKPPVEEPKAVQAPAVVPTPEKPQPAPESLPPEATVVPAPNEVKIPATKEPKSVIVHRGNETTEVQID